MKYILAIGSNLQPRVHVRWLLKQMLESFKQLHVSRFFRAPAYGMQSSHVFWNGAVLIESSLDPNALKKQLCLWEEQSGRDRSHPQCSLSDRTLDVDVIWCEGVGWLESLNKVKSCPYLYLPISSLIWMGRDQHIGLKPIYFSFSGRLLGGRPVCLK